MRRPTSLAPLNLGSSLSPLSSPDDENRPPPSLSDSGRFNFGHLQIDTQGVVPSSRDSGYSELTDDSGAFAAGAGAGGGGGRDCFNCGKDKYVIATGSDTVTDCIDCDKAQGQVRWIGKERPGIRLHRLRGR